jgi:type I restriction enzyme S subunit
MKKYDKYKDTNIEWLGEIPENWDLTKFRWLGDFNKNLVKDKVDNFKVLSLTIKGVIQRDLDSNYGKFPTSFSTYQLVKPDDIVICLFDMDVTPRIVGISDQEGIISPAYTIMSTKETVDANYIFYYLLEQDRNKSLLYNGTGLRRTLTRTRFANLPTIIPPLPEQTKISSYLDNKTSLIDKLINNNKKLIKLLEEKRTALINKVITKGLDPNVKMKDSGIEWIGEIPEHWEVMRLSYCSFIGSGTTPKSDDEKYYQSGDVNWLITGDLKSKYITNTSRKITEKALEDYSTLKEYPIDSVVIAMYGATIGAVSILKVCSTVNQACAVITPRYGLLYEFLYYFLLGNKEKLLSDSVGGGQPNVSQSILKSQIIAFPSNNEQKEIIILLNERLALIEKDIEIFNKENKLLKEYRQSLISNVVTGKVDVRERNNIKEKTND